MFWNPVKYCRLYEGFSLGEKTIPKECPSLLPFMSPFHRFLWVIESKDIFTELNFHALGFWLYFAITAATNIILGSSYFLIHIKKYQIRVQVADLESGFSHEKDLFLVWLLMHATP